MRKRNLLFWILGLLIALQSIGINAQTAGSVFMGGRGFVSGIIAAPNDKNVFYARTDVGGAYRWNESTKSWVPLIDWASADQRGLIGIDGIAVDPQVKGRVYMLAGTSYWNNGLSMFLSSEDYGATWTKLDVTAQFKAHGNGMGRENGERLAVDPNNSNIIICGTRYNGLWKSTNRGVSWTQVTALNVITTPNESGICNITFDKSKVSGGITQTIYAGVSRENDNLYVSNDAGATWSLVTGHPTTGRIMPQHMAISANGRFLYVTYGNGDGPHAMLWNGVADYFNRGAIYKFDTQLNTWTDISPENFMLDLGSVNGDVIHYGAFSAISIDPSNEGHMMATSINSYRGPQFWNIGGTWKDVWGDNIYMSVDTGKTWREMFRYYWVDGGNLPDYKVISENGIPWIIGNTIHWIGAGVIDPFNPNRAFVTSGNGVFSTDSLLSTYVSTDWVNNVQVTKYHGRATWNFAAKGIEETVPQDMVSIPGGPIVSVIGDYDGFIQTDINAPAPAGRLMTTVNGVKCALGSTTGVAYAAQKTSVLAKASGNTASANGQNVTLCGVTISTDGGANWNMIYADATPVSQPIAKGKFHNGKLAISADGAVVVWAPDCYQVSSPGATDTSDSGAKEMFYYMNSAWKKCVGIEFNGRPVADPVDANTFYVFNRTDGYLYVSSDKGATFTKKGLAGIGDFRTARVATGVKGDVWVPLARNVSGVKSGGLTRSIDGGTTFSAITNVTYCEAVGFGKAATGKTYPTVFIYGTVNSVTGVFMSIDQGASWTRVNDDQHQYGGIANGEFVVGDENTYGLVYMSTAGRGIAWMKGSGTTVSVTGVTVAPTTASVIAGSTAQLSATVAPTNASNQNVSWTSSNTAVATVSSTGLVTGVAAGTATISVTTQDGSKTATCAVTVSGTISVTGVSLLPTTASINIGSTTQLAATVAPTNASNKTVSWTSSNTAVATVSSTGLVTGVVAGTATITVTTQDGSKTATCAVTVTNIAVTGVTLSATTLAIGVTSTSQLTATLAPTNATNKTISWTSSNTAVASVSSSGLVTGIAVGSAIITVTTQDGSKTATCSVTVSGIPVTGVTMSPTAVNVPVPTTSQLTATIAPTNATNKNVTWTSSNTAIAIVSSTGLVTAIAGGSVIITITTQDGAKTATCVVTVGGNVNVTGVTLSLTTASIGVGATSQLTATIAPANATLQSVTWTSSNTSIATVSSTSLVTGVAAGTATITVTTQDGAKTATCAVTVSNIAVTGVTMSSTTASVNPGATVQLSATIAPANATIKTVTWTSSSISIATVSSIGLVTGVANGTATITVTTQDGAKTATCVVSVSTSTACTFGTPTAAALPTLNKTYTKVYVLGTGGPNLSNVTNFTINWDLANKGLWQMSTNTNNGVPSWYNDLKVGATQTFASAQPAITLSGTGVTGFDGSYNVTIYNITDFVMVSKTGGFAIYFSNSSTAPVCVKSAPELSNIESGNILLYPNPVDRNSTLTMSLNSVVSNGAQYSIIDLNGMSIISGTITAGDNLIHLNGKISSGMYIIRVMNGNEQFFQKLIVR